MSSTFIISVLTDAASVIGERIITPLAIIFLVVKLRVPSQAPISKNSSTMSPPPKGTEARDQEFLTSKKDAEDLSLDGAGSAWAHAPYWPLVRSLVNNLVS
jgi:translocation protein SEC63